MFLFARCFHLLVKILIKVKNGLMMNPEVENRSICVWLLYCVINFCRFANGGVKISIKVLRSVAPCQVSYSLNSDFSTSISYLRNALH